MNTRNNIHGMIRCICATANENQTLATLRDGLLRRLMSGEFCVGEARDQVEPVA